MEGFLLLILGGVALYGHSLWRHPYRICKRCRGGDVSDAVWKTAFGNCWSCGGRGQFPRLGVKIFMPGTAKKIASRQHGKNF